MKFFFKFANPQKFQYSGYMEVLKNTDSLHKHTPTLCKVKIAEIYYVCMCIYIHIYINIKFLELVVFFAHGYIII